MEYKLALVDGFGSVVAQVEGAALHPHGSATEVLDRSIPGVGRKGDAVRVPSPLEHPASADDLAGHKLALVGTTPDGDSILHVLEYAGHGFAELAGKVTQLTNDVAAVYQAINTLRADVSALKTKSQ